MNLDIMDISKNSLLPVMTTDDKRKKQPVSFQRIRIDDWRSGDWSIRTSL